MWFARLRRRRRDRALESLKLWEVTIWKFAVFHASGRLWRWHRVSLCPAIGHDCSVVEGAGYDFGGLSKALKSCLEQTYSGGSILGI